MPSNCPEENFQPTPKVLLHLTVTVSHLPRFLTPCVLGFVVPDQNCRRDLTRLSFFLLLLFFHKEMFLHLFMHISVVCLCVSLGKYFVHPALCLFILIWANVGLFFVNFYSLKTNLQKKRLTLEGFELWLLDLKEYTLTTSSRIYLFFNGPCPASFTFIFCCFQTTAQVYNK